MNTEKKTANAILEKEEGITIAGITYKFAPPQVQTIIEISGMIGELPSFNFSEEEEESKIIDTILANADKMSMIPYMVAKLILGVCKPSNGLDNIIKHYKYKKSLQALINSLRYDVSPNYLYQLFIFLLKRTQIKEFTQLFFSLNEINLLKRTKGIETIQSGR